MPAPGNLLLLKVFQSSHLQSASYDPSTHVLVITFTNGRKYQNAVDAPVPGDVWAELIRTGSPGVFFDQNIKPYWRGVEMKAQTGAATPASIQFDPSQPVSPKSIP